VGAATHIVGLVLPFAFYTAMSSTIAFVIGPAGWTVLGIAVLAKMFGPEYDLMIKGIVAISGARAELLVKWEQRLSAARDRAAAARQILRCRLSAWRRTFAQLVRVSISWLLLLTLGASLGAAAAMQVWRGMP
jgi:hypothetical protein